jgi:hypothetical protein
VDNSLEGSTGKPFRIVVEEGKVREFARATKSADPAYGTGEAPGSTSPVTFLASSMFWQGPANSPWGEAATLHWERILHGEQEFNFTGPPPTPGTVLTGQARIQRVYEKQGKRGGTMTFAEVVTEYRDESGNLVADSRSTVIETSQAPES